MKTLTTLALAALTISMVACAAEEPTEETGQTEDHYDVACVSNIQAPPGSPAWRAELQNCIGGYTGGGGGVVNTGGNGGNGGQSCSQSTSCINGSCTCGAGPNQGRACIGSQPSGPSSCSELCRFCK